MWFENNPGRSPSLDGKSGRTSNIWIQDKLIAVHFPLFSLLDFCYGTVFKLYGTGFRLYVTVFRLYGTGFRLHGTSSRLH